MTAGLRRSRSTRAALGGVLALLAAGCAAGTPPGPGVDGRSGAAPPAASSKRVGADRFGTMMRLGDAARRSGDWGAAASLYRQATDVDPTEPRGHVALGEALIAIGSPGAAAKAFREALGLAPGDRDAVLGYARALIELDRPGEAAERYAELVEADPADVRALNGLGIAQDLAGRHDEAQATYRRGLIHDPDNMALRNNLGLSLALGKEPQAAIPILHRVASSPGATARNRQNLALAYGLSGDAANAERVARLDLDEDAVRDNLVFYAEVRRRHGAPTPPAGAASVPTAPVRPDPPAPGGGRRRAEPDSGARAASEPPPEVTPAEPIVINLDARLPSRSRAAAAGPGALAPPAAEAAGTETGTEAAAGRGGADGGGMVQRAAPVALEGHGLQLGSSADGHWFLELGEYADGRRAADAWRDLRRRYPEMSHLNRLASIERGRQPLLVGPVAGGARARELCRRLEKDGAACRAVLP